MSASVSAPVLCQQLWELLCVRVGVSTRVGCCLCAFEKAWICGLLWVLVWACV